jgi:hypothetical protein
VAHSPDLKNWIGSLGSPLKERDNERACLIRLASNHRLRCGPDRHLFAWFSLVPGRRALRRAAAIGEQISNVNWLTIERKFILPKKQPRGVAFGVTMPYGS